MDECIFCKIANKEIPTKTFYEDENYLAFLDIRPLSKGHLLVIPKQHYETFLDMPSEEEKELFAKVQELSKVVKEKLGAKLIFLLVMGEEVPHVHVHIIPYYGGEFPISLSGHDSTELDEVLSELQSSQQ